MSRFGLYGKIVVQPGQRDAMVAILLEAAALLQSDPECDLYTVSVSATEPDTVWVAEAWSSQAAHAAALAREEIMALINNGRPLIMGGERIEVVPIGGKGLPTDDTVS